MSLPAARWRRKSLYLLFNEGYKASGGDKLIREAICAEAMRLTSQLAQHPSGDRPATNAPALMLLNAARIPARVDPAGNLLLLEDQGRSLWDQSMIARGLFHLTKSASGDVLTVYHFQPGSPHAVHGGGCISTDWTQILTLYDRLMQFDDSPVIALNRAVALAEVHGPAAGIAAAEALREPLESYYPVARRAGRI